MAERKSTFKGDLKSERAVNEFLQKYLYSYLVDDGIIDSFNSNTTLDQQHNGIDTIMYIINDETEEAARCINIDEKELYTMLEIIWVISLYQRLLLKFLI